MDATAYTVQVSCKCEVCKINADKVGAAFPLAARIRPLTAQTLGITERNAHGKKAHGLVHFAHDPANRGLKSAPIAIPAA